MSYAVLGKGQKDLALETSKGTFGMEFVLTFLLVYAVRTAQEPPRTMSNNYYNRYNNKNIFHMAFWALENEAIFGKEVLLYIKCIFKYQ